MLLVQKYLLEHSFIDLIQEHAVYPSFDKSGSKWSLNYSQIEAKDNNPIAQECRGLILASEDNRSFISQAKEINGKLSYDHICPGRTHIVALPFFRFFNFGQEAAIKINWDDPKLSIQEKLDGSLCIVYACPITNSFQVATRSVPNADQLMDNQKYTFRQLFEKALEEQLHMSFDDFTRAHLQKHITYLFELTSAYNQIVVKYEKPSITLLGARDINTLQEIDISTLNVPVPRPHIYALNSLDEILAYVSSREPFEHEGVVVCDSSFRRVKIKNPSYVIAHKLKSSIGSSPRNMLEAILLGKDDDIISLLPKELADDLEQMKAKLVQVINNYDLIYKTIMNMKPASKKEFAVIVHKQNIYAVPFYKFYDGKASNMRDFIEKNKEDNGSFGDSFLDKLLEIIKE